MRNQEGLKVEEDFFSCMEKIFNGDKTLTVLMSDDGNHFTDYGIIENMILFFDSTMKHEAGCLACYSDIYGNNYLSAEKSNDKYVGLLIMSMKGHGRSNDRTQKSVCNS